MTRIFAGWAAAMALLVALPSAHAVPITADIYNFSVVHLGSNPAGTGDQADWFRFDAGQTLDLDLTNNFLALLAPQSFTLTTDNGATGLLELLSFSMDLNDSDGFLGGSIDYVLNGAAGQFLFSDSNYGSSVYNSSSVENGIFSLFIWGGDDANDLGLDLGISAQIPEPGILVLMVTGLIALRLFRR
ncbi:MAG: hypothetical protein AAF465_03795 [Pseudomonadota bacterium]